MFQIRISRHHPHWRHSRPIWTQPCALSREFGPSDPLRSLPSWTIPGFCNPGLEEFSGRCPTSSPRAWKAISPGGVLLVGQAMSPAAVTTPPRVLQSSCTWSSCQELCHRLWMADWMQLVCLCLSPSLVLWMIHCQSEDERKQSTKAPLSASLLSAQRGRAGTQLRAPALRMLLWGAAGN